VIGRGKAAKSGEIFLAFQVDPVLVIFLGQELFIGSFHLKNVIDELQRS
jgi:hypothetical protein